MKDQSTNKVCAVRDATFSSYEVHLRPNTWKNKACTIEGCILFCRNKLINPPSSYVGRREQGEHRAALILRKTSLGHWTLW